MGAALVAALALFGLVGLRSALSAQDATQRIETNTAPALITVQSVFASVAEANAAATGAVLTGGRTERNLYLSAIARAARQSEQVSSLVGNAPTSHEALQMLNEGLVRYSGAIEASRATNLASRATNLAASGAVTSADGAEEAGDATTEESTADAEASSTAPAVSETVTEQLAAAFSIARIDVSDAVDVVTSEGQAELDVQQSRIGSGVLTLAAFIVALGALVLFQMRLTTRTNRWIHPWLVTASVLLIVAMATHASSLANARAALDDAEQLGFASISATSEIQAAAYDLQTDLAFATLQRQPIDPSAAIADVEASIDAASGLADSDRERAAVDTLQIRWDRYRTEVQAIAAESSPVSLARLQGDGLAAFNGFNTSIESVLLDNRSQFSDGAANATAAVRWLSISTVVLTLLSVLCVLAGVSRRLREYR